MQKKRDVYHVTPRSKGGWDIQKEGGKRPSGNFDKKIDAIERGKELAKKGGIGQLKIHKHDGNSSAVPARTCQCLLKPIKK